MGEPLWRSLEQRAREKAIATALNCHIDVPDAAELGAAFGAARLGMMAAIGKVESIATPPTIKETIAPDPDLIAAFDDGMARYRAAQRAIGEIA